MLRYAQCWEDADILLDALDVHAGDVVLSIASAGENTLSLLTRAPARVVAIDLSRAQLAALELRVAAYRTLEHGELLELIGSRASRRRMALYARCAPLLSVATRAFWSARLAAVEQGIGGAGKFERYFHFFREYILPLVHRRHTVQALLTSRDAESRRLFYDERWDTPAWRLLFRAFFSETVLGRLGRDPRLFRHATDNVAEHLLGRVRHALAVLDPSENPYVDWILTGQHRHALPHALRPENFDAIREHLDRLEWHCAPLAAVGPHLAGERFDRANLSDVMEYMADDEARSLLDGLLDNARAGARIAYWNMIVPRHGADYLPQRLRPLQALSRSLFERDKAFFYRDFIVEEVVC
ncbi:MAG: DUF3419 family protein [Gemmatimonadaceae bacterium]